MGKEYVLDLSVESIYLEPFRSRPTMHKARVAFVELLRNGKELPQDLLEYIATDFDKSIQDYEDVHPENEMRVRDMVELMNALEHKPDNRTMLSVFDEYAVYYGVTGTAKSTPGELLRDRYKNFLKNK